MRLRNTFLIILASALVAVSWLALPAGANENEMHPPEAPVQLRGVIELFTSQGCSACPPADKELKALATDPSIIALSLPVDYWNYLGWTDTLASSRNSDRQRNYARARGDGAIYTPQAVVNGVMPVNGSSRASIEHALAMTADKAGPQHIPVRFWQQSNTLNFALGAEEPGHSQRDATIWLGVVQSLATVEIKQGENEGKTLTYTNVVRELTPIGIWKGRPMEIQLPRAALMQAEVQKIVVLLQEGRSGAIIGGMLAGLW